jgi:hypothetical protein
MSDPLRTNKAQHRLVIHFKSTEKMSALEEFRSRPNYGPGMKKPVVYLYSKEEVNVDLNLHLANNGKMSFTYPKYEDGWNVSVNKVGIVAYGKSFPYLFWEGHQPGLDFLKTKNSIQANIIEKDEVVSYLETTLSKIGLNATEMTDFITFWAPQMIQYNKLAVQFLFNESYDEHIAHLEMSPEPNNSLRIYMIYREVSSDEQMFQKQIIEPSNFKRDGLTIVEWGGTELTIVPGPNSDIGLVND